MYQNLRQQKAAQKETPKLPEYSVLYLFHYLFHSMLVKHPPKIREFKSQRLDSTHPSLKTKYKCHSLKRYWVIPVTSGRFFNEWGIVDHKTFITATSTCQCNMIQLSKTIKAQEKSKFVEHFPSCSYYPWVSSLSYLISVLRKYEIWTVCYSGPTYKIKRRNC